MAENLYQFDNSTGQSLSTFGVNTKLINCFVAPSVKDARSKFELRMVEGVENVLELAPDNGTGCRALWESSTGPRSQDYKPTRYTVYGDTLFRITSANTAIKVGQLSLSTRKVSFAESQEQGSSRVWAFVCDGALIYKFDLTADDSEVALTFAQTGKMPYVNGSSVETAIPSAITYYNYRLLFACTNSNQWFYSGINDSVFDSAKFYTSESSADKTKRVYGIGGNLWVFSETSYEIFARTGNASNPFASPFGNSGTVGLVGYDAICELDNNVFWIGSGKTANCGVYSGSASGKLMKISDTGLDNVLRTCKYLQDAKAFAYRLNGCSHVVFTSVSDGLTFSYEIEANSWSLRSSSKNGKQSYWDTSEAVISYNGDCYTGSIKTNKLSKMTVASVKDAEENPISILWQSPIFIADLKQFVLKQLVVDVESGKSKSYTEEPKLFLQVSRDGESWGERRILELGVRGEYNKQIRQYGFGACRNLVIRIGGSPTVNTTLYQLRFLTEVFRV